MATSPACAVAGRDDLFADGFACAQAPHANYDVSADGTRSLMVKNVRTPDVLVVYGWLGERERRLAG